MSDARAGRTAGGLARPPRVDRAGLLVTAACGAAVLGWVPTARDSFGSSAQTLTGTGRIAGLLAAALLLVQVLLMAGPGWLTRGLGPAGTQRRHRSVGTASLVLLAAHIVLVVPGHAAITRQRLWPQLVQMVLHYPGMLPALAGSGVLVAIAVTSMRRARRRIGYRRWHALHLYAYLGIGLALPHQLRNGTDLIVSTPVRIGWWASWLAVASVMLVRRVVPAANLLRRRHRPWATTSRPVVAGWFGALAVGGLLLRYPTAVPAPTRTDAVTRSNDMPTGDLAPDRGGMDMSGEEEIDAALVVPPVAVGETAVDGRRVETDYGPLQVQIRVREGRIVAAYAIAYPDAVLADRSVSSFSLPDLEAATVAAQSAHIDTVSGATSTSEAYRTSLQAALDAAHL